MRAFPLALGAAVLGLAVLAGALPDPVPSDLPAERAAAAPVDDKPEITEVRFYGCTAHFGYLPLESGEADAHAPPGFGTQPWIGDGFRAATAYSQHCTRIETDTGHVFADYTETMHLMRLAPPPEHETPGVHNLPLRIMTNDPVLAELYRDWGWSDTVSIGEVTVDTTIVEGQGIRGTTVGTAPDWGMALTVSGAPTTGTWDGTHIRFYGRNDAGNVSTISEFQILPATVWPAATIHGQSVFSYTHGGATQQAVSAGLGQLFQWNPDGLTQTLTLLSG